jgi:hypothetical protein
MAENNTRRKYFAMNTKIALTIAVALLGTAIELLASPGAGTILWMWNVGSPIQSSPALAPDGTVYVGTLAGMRAITNAGSLASNKWVFAAGSAVYGSPAVAHVLTRFERWVFGTTSK